MYVHNSIFGSFGKIVMAKKFKKVNFHSEASMNKHLLLWNVVNPS